MSPQEAIIARLGRDYGCHTLVLYGSRAQGAAHEDSDWNVLGVYDEKASGWFHRRVEGVGQVNAEFYPEAALTANMAGTLNFQLYASNYAHAQVLVEKDGWGQRIITAASQWLAQPPKPVSASFARMLRHYYEDIIVASQRDERLLPLTKQFTCHEGLTRSLQQYFSLRGLHRRSAPEAIGYLRQQDPAAYALFEVAIRPAAPVEAVAAWLACVLANAPR